MNISAESFLPYARIAEITYENPDTATQKFKELNCDVIKFFDVQGAQGYLLNRFGSHILSFRGTEVKEVSDVLADLKAGKNYEIDKHSGTAIGKVHHGFKKELDKLWPDIELAVTNINYLYVTGHSLGAAMATIAASRLDKKVITLITFGSPRVGTKEFVNNCNFVHYRVQNNCDDVTKVPPYIMGFRHHGNHVYMSVDGQFKKLTVLQLIKDMIHSRIVSRLKRKRFIGITDHFMSNYISKLKSQITSKK